MNNDVETNIVLGGGLALSVVVISFGIKLSAPESAQLYIESEGLISYVFSWFSSHSIGFILETLLMISVVVVIPLGVGGAIGNIIGKGINSMLGRSSSAKAGNVIGASMMMAFLFLIFVLLLSGVGHIFTSHGVYLGQKTTNGRTYTDWAPYVQHCVSSQTFLNKCDSDWVMQNQTETMFEIIN